VYNFFFTKSSQSPVNFAPVAWRSWSVALLATFLLGCGVTASPANVVRPVPDFSWIGLGGKVETLTQFRGQPVILLITTGPRNWAFRSQIGQLQSVYQRLAATGAVCVAAFTRETGVIRSNIPFVQAQDGPRVAFLTGTQGPRFTIILIGKDGNMDAISQSVLSGQRVLDIISNSFVVQQTLRRP
jgi:hypothetical protein